MWLRFSLTLSAAITSLSIGLLLGFLIYSSWPVFAAQGIGFLWGAEWYPYEALFGMLPVLLGSAFSVGLALFIALPLGLSAAVMSAELLGPRQRSALRFLMELAAGIPSVVYGLLGLWVLLPWLETGLGMLTGRSLLAAGLLLALMILPTLMILAEEAIYRVKIEQREAAANLGLHWWQRLHRVVLPQAWPGIRVAILLSLGRAMGETVAVMLVVGSIDRLPEPFYNLLQPAQTLTSRIGREMGEVTLGSEHWAALMSSGLLLALVAMLLAFLAQRRV